MAPEDNIHHNNQQDNTSRIELIWEALVFQLKLALDGLRDVILVPVSIVAAILGLVAGGSDPRQYFRRVLRFGRATEAWLNLFGGRDQSGTSDEVLEPFKAKVMEQAAARSHSDD